MKSKTPLFRRYTRLVLLCLAFIWFTPVMAGNKVVVIPLGSDAPKSIKNVVYVSPKGGDFKTLESALNSINDVSFYNPYLIILGPGEYSLSNPVTLSPGMHVTGSGIYLTSLDSYVSDAVKGPSAAAITLNPGTSLSNLSLTNGGAVSGTETIAILLNDSGTLNLYASISNVYIFVSSEAGNVTGIYGAASNSLFDSIDITDSEIDTSYYGSGNSSSVGLDLGSDASMENISVSANNFSSGDGIGMKTTTFSSVRNSTIQGSSSSIMIGSASAKWIMTQLDGSVNDASGATNCLGTYDFNLIPVNC